MECCRSPIKRDSWTALGVVLRLFIVRSSTLSMIISNAFVSVDFLALLLFCDWLGIVPCYFAACPSWIHREAHYPPRLVSSSQCLSKRRYILWQWSLLPVVFVLHCCGKRWSWRLLHNKFCLPRVYWRQSSLRRLKLVFMERSPRVREFFPQYLILD